LSEAAEYAGGRLERAGLSSEQRTAARDVVVAFLASRAIVWVTGVVVASVLGVRAGQAAHLDPTWATTPFLSDLGNVLVAPAARFDSSWLLQITESGYSATGTAAFFPLYPALVAILGAAIGSTLIAGVLISSAASAAGLYLLHRLVALDYGGDIARTTVWITAFFPVAFTLSAVYTEGLFLALSVGAIYAARLGRWPLAAVAILFAAMTRSVGLLLLVPVVLLYLYGPRADRAPDWTGRHWRPAYRIRPDLAWMAIAPAGVLAFAAYLGVATGDMLATLGAESGWNRVVAPLAGPVMGLVSAGRGVFDLAFNPSLVGSMPGSRAGGLLNLALFGFLVLALWLAVDGAKRLPVAYTGYVVASLALPFSTPALDEPLMSLPRFEMVLFPLWIVLALKLGERRRSRRALAIVEITLLVACTGLFVAWVLAP
jgi:hypothetical protein